MTGESRRPRCARSRLATRCHAILACVVAAFVAFAAPQALAQERRPRLECSLERASCFQGEAVGYTVEALDVDDPAAPDLSGFEEFDVTVGGSQSLNSTSIQIVNGQMTRVERVGTQFHYTLAPRRTGRLIVPAPTVAAGGRKLAGQPLELEVAAPDSQDFVRLLIGVAPAEVFPLRPVTVSLRVFVKRIAGARERDPIALLSQLDPPPTPMLRVPWVEAPAGLRAGEWKEWLTPHLLRDRRGERGGFGINELQSQGMPSLLGDFFEGPRYALFDLEGRPASGRDVADLPELQTRAGDYFVYHLEREVTPMRSGVFDFGPASFKGRLVETLRDRRVTLKEIFAVAAPAQLVVKEVPSEGKPASFTGAIGSFAIEASVAPTRARVGDPLTLTITVTGEGNLEEIGPPALGALPAFAAGFKVYDASAETKGGARVFTCSLRPLATTVTAVPPVPLSWFDVVREQYVTAETKPIAIEVGEAARLDPGAIVSGGARGGGEPTLSAHAEGLFGHDTDPRHLGDERVEWKLHAAAAVLMPLATLAGLSALAGFQRRHSDPRARRRRGAAARARERLGRAARLARDGDAIAAADALRLALCGIVADAADLHEAGLTARETKAALAGLAATPQLADAAGAALERWESLRYAGSGLDAAALVRDGTALIEQVLGELARGGRLA